jgi:G3E family GTPase
MRIVDKDCSIFLHMTEQNPSSAAKVPATLFSGFLGSGKTTIINHLVDDLQGQGIQVAYIKNEVGADTIDEDLVRGKHIMTKELLNGCICCTLVGNFYQALTEIVQSIHPDRILIEASGVGDPVAIALTLESHPLVRRDGVVTIIDVVNYNGVPDLNKVSQHQAQFTDLIIFNKVELADEQRKRQVVGYVREINTAAPIIEAPGGHVHPSLVFGIFPSDLAGQNKMLELQRLAEQKDAALHASGEEHDHALHLETDHVENFSITTLSIYDQEKLQTALAQLPQQIFRIKGFVKMGTAENNKMMIINGVNRQIEITDVPEGFVQTEGKIVCIGFMINALRPEVDKAFTSAVVG